MPSQLIPPLKQFLQQNYDPARPIVVALSGGVDSTALLDALFSLRSALKLDLHVAHVDHGWRQESEEQADLLEESVVAMGLPFHRTQLDPSSYKGNLECAARLERMAFLSACCREVGGQAVVLGHHADDQAETVLKKTLQGNALPFLGGMSPIGQYDGVPLWRPLLALSKETVTHHAAMRGLPVLDDPSNRDDRFLRTRMRESLFPLIAQHFGKEVRGALSRLGAMSTGLNAYLDRRIEPLMTHCVSGPLGVYLSVSSAATVDVVELEHLIRSVCERAGMRLPHTLIPVAVNLLKEGVPNKKVAAADGTLYIDRFRLFAVSDDHSLPGEGDVAGRWSVRSHEGQAMKGASQVSDPLAALWTGNATTVLPSGGWVLCQSDSQLQVSAGKTLGDWWSGSKVPAFMRGRIPILRAESMSGELAVWDPLSGRRTGGSTSSECTGSVITLQWQGLSASRSKNGVSAFVPPELGVEA